MKRATPTQNRFITSTPSWWVNGFVLFAFFFLLDGCVDETSSIGFRKEPRMEVRFKEFSIPATTVQADSLNSQIGRSSSIADRWLCGIIDNPVDPNFGKLTASIFTKILPGSKINRAGRTDFVLNKLTLNVVLDSYVYGDTLNSQSTFTLHEITDNEFNQDKDYFTNSNVSFNSTVLSTGIFDFKNDSIKKNRALNTDASATNNKYDTLSFDIPVSSNFSTTLFDTLMRKGYYTWQKVTIDSKGTVKDSLAYNTRKTDSVFLKTFKGFAIAPQSGNRILGFTSRVSSLAGSTRLTLYYSYSENGVSASAKYYLYFQGDDGYYQDIPSFTRIQTDRSSTAIAALPAGNKYVNFTAPDNYCYLQAGTGLYAKLDFTAVMDTINLHDRISINSAELIVPVESSLTRSHLKPPSGLFLRILKNNLRLFSPPLIPAKTSTGSAVLTSDPTYSSYYYCTYQEGFLDATSDDRVPFLNVAYKEDSGEKYYHAYLSNFLQYQTRLPNALTPLNHMALVPSTFFGKSLDGVTFKSDQVKLRVYYSIPK